MNKCAIILAAGEGKRMLSDIPKTLHKIVGKEMLNHVIDNIVESEITNINIVVGVGADKVKENIKDRNVNYSLQEKQLGTGHAVISAEEFLLNQKGFVLIINGDAPLIKKESILKAVQTFEREKVKGLIATTFMPVDKNFAYGKIIRNNNKDIIEIKEYKDCTDEEKLIREINVGLYIFDIELLLNVLKELKTNNAQGEYYLTDAISILTSRGEKVESIEMEFNESLGVNSREELFVAEKLMKDRINGYHMSRGVTLIDKDNTYIGCDVEISNDVIIYPNNFIEGKTIISKGVTLLPGNRISNTKIGENTVIENTVVLDSVIGKNINIGPFAYVRPGSFIDDGVKIGDFVEIKNSSVGKKTKISHLTYVGDADVGENCNFGCGTVVVNYDGIKKYRTIIGNNVFIGCNTNLIAPVEVEENSYTAAGSTITQKVKSGDLAIARSKQININGWVEKRNKSK